MASAPNWPVLNWKEIARLAETVRPRIEGLFVDRIVVPERARFPGGYVKGEWGLRLTGRKEEGVFVFSVRARHPYFYFIPGKGPKAAPGATRSPFDLEAGKHLKGRRVLGLEALPRERTIVLWFGDPEGEGRRLGLALNLIPAAAEALLLRKSPEQYGETAQVVSRSRAGKGTEGAGAPYVFPDGSKAPENPPVREDLVGSEFARAIEAGLEREAFELRLAAALRELRALLKQARERLRQTEVTLAEANRDADWQRSGDLLKASFHEAPPVETREGRAFRRVRDPENGEETLLPCDPKLGLAEQVEKFYQLARRKARRISEAGTRRDHLRESVDRLERLLEGPPAFPSWSELEKLERAANVPVHAASPASRGAKKAGAWLGKSFTSRDGLAILVGRSKDENLELTFKHARGNDLWMHVRGRPGAHVLIPLQPGKSAPLETLLDAAVLCIYYSGGESWGKTEVDYAFKKHVRRIKDSSEASYAQNKTLLVEPEAARLKRLLG